MKTMHGIVNDEHKAGQQSRTSPGLSETVHSVVCSVNWLIVLAQGLAGFLFQFQQ